MKFLEFALISLQSECSFHQFKTCNVLNVLDVLGAAKFVNSPAQLSSSPKLCSPAARARCFVSPVSRVH